MEDLGKMKIVELKKKCKELGLLTSGVKSDLISRLEEHLNKDESVLNEAELLGEMDAEDCEKSPVSNVDEDLLLGESVTEEKEVDIENEINNDQEDDKEKTQEPVEVKDATDVAETPAKVQKIDNIVADALKEVPETKSVQITEEERLKQRAARFLLTNNASNESETKKIERAKRFGLEDKSNDVISTTAPLINSAPVDVDNLKKRAERFGVTVSDTLSKEVEDEKKRKRQERFGITQDIKVPEVVQTELSTKVDERKTLRAARFGVVSVVDDDKKKARAARFGLAK